MTSATEAIRQPDWRSGAGGPIVVFEDVSLAFDDAVVLRNISFSLMAGHTKIILGASGSGSPQLSS